MTKLNVDRVTIREGFNTTRSGSEVFGANPREREREREKVVLILHSLIVLFQTETSVSLITVDASKLVRTP